MTDDQSSNTKKVNTCGSNAEARTSHAMFAYRKLLERRLPPPNSRRKIKVLCILRTADEKPSRQMTHFLQDTTGENNMN